MTISFDGNACTAGNYLNQGDGACYPLLTGYGFDEAQFLAAVPTTVFAATALTQSAITAAISAAAANGGGVVQLPAGSGTLTATIAISSNNILIEGAGIDSTTLSMSADTNVFKFSDCRNVAIRDLTIRPGRRGVVLFGVENAMVERVRAAGGTESSFDIRYVENFTIRYCRSEDTGRHGIGLKDCYEDEGVLAADLTYATSQYNGHSLTYGPMWSRSLAFYSNMITGHRVHGINSHGMDKEICGNYVSAGGYGGKAFDGRNLLLHHNTFANNGHGFMFNFTLDIATHKTGLIILRCNDFSGNGVWDLYFGDQYNIGYDWILLDSNTYDPGVISPAHIDAADLLVCSGSEAASILASGDYTTADADSCGGCDAGSTPGDTGCSGGLLINGDFYDGLASWSFSTDGTASIDASSGAAVATVTSGGTDTNLRQAGLSITSGGRYLVEFYAYADVACSISLDVVDDGTPSTNLGLAETVALTTSNRVYRYTLVATATNDNARLQFSFDGLSGKTITIDDVCVRELTGGEITADFDASPLTGEASLSVTLRNLSYADSAPSAWSWKANGVEFSTAEASTHSFTAAGDYTISLTATSADGSDTMTRTGYVNVTPSSGGASGSQTLQVGASADNCELSDGGTLSTTLIRTYNKTGFRFTLATAIPDGSTITAATMDLESNGTGTSPYPTLTIRGENDTDPATYSTNTDFNSRTETTASTSWAPGTWPSSGWTTTDDFTSVVQEILDDEAGLAVGDTIAIRINDESSQAGFIKIHPYSSGSANAGKIDISWTEPTVTGLDAMSVQVASGSDDCERRSSGFDLSLLGIRTHDYAGMRFVLPREVPAGATITAANLSLYASGSGTVALFPVVLTIRAEDANDQATYSDGTDFDARTETTASVAWSLASWTLSAWHDSPDIKSLIQGLLDDHGLPSSAAIALHANDEASSADFIKFAAYEYGAAYAPTLTIEWSTSGVGNARGIAEGVGIGVGIGIGV